MIEKACRGEEIVIARGKKPVVRLVAIEDKTGHRKPGALRGKLKVGPEFAVSAWEISTKFRLGRLPTASDLVQDFGGYVDRENFLSLEVSYDHGIRAGMLPGPHRDPFDRMLIAQAEIEKLFIISNEKIFDHYGVSRIW